MSATAPVVQARFRLASGGVIDRNTRLAFSFDGRDYTGHRGDTLASALLAHGVHHVARSFKYHRPRGIFSAGSEEPAALVQLDRHGDREPNARATTVELTERLVARTQHCWPSLAHDAGAIAGAFTPLLPAGFYYKTFMWPPSPQGWLFWEHWIRRAAGLGRAPMHADPARYEHRHAHCDVLVVGGGVAGLAAARAAAACGARVMICNEAAHWGGQPHGDEVTIDGAAWRHWVDSTVDALAPEPDVTLLARTTAVACYDDNMVVLAERPNPFSPASPFAERLWKVRAGAVVLATGSHERLIAYPGNDVPGTMLAASAATYVHRYAVKPGSRAVVFTNNDAAYAAAHALRTAGVEIAAVVDARPRDAASGAQAADGFERLHQAVIVRAHGRRRVAAVDVATAGNGTRRIACDLVCVSGGFNPAVHLWSQSRGLLRYDPRIAGFVPDAAAPVRVEAAGAARGSFDLADCLREGHEAGLRAALRPDQAAPAIEPPHAQATAQSPLQPLWSVPSRHPGKAFVDLLDDVSVADVALAAREGYTSIEHLKRYTTLGMGPDQGKIGNVTGLAVLAEATGRDIGAAGTTTFRAPYTPVPLGAFPGLEHGPHVEPTRYSAMHDWHAAHGASFVNAGLWKRPHSYPRPGESADDAANREARNVRAAVGIVDVSTLGKIELGGRDAAAFLDRVYANRFDNLAVGRCRYGIMLRDDGMVLDDGTVSRLGPRHYLVTTTTANALTVMQRLERLLQVDWPDLEVWLTSVTEQWSAAAVSGPRSRELLAQVLDIGVGHEAFPFLAVGDCLLRTADGWIPARLLRVSYSGELAYEVHVAANRGQAMWDALLAAGQPLGVMPYGTEAMGTLRIEKGHVVVGAEIDGRTTADDLGLGKLVSAAKSCVGKALLDRPALRDPDRWQLVGLTALEGAAIPRGAKLVADANAVAPVAMQGHVTSWCWSANLQRWIALALLSRGRARHGETLWAVSPLADARVRVSVGSPCFVDPEGARLRG